MVHKASPILVLAREKFFGKVMFHIKLLLFTH